jgi:hypothetical protein
MPSNPSTSVSAGRVVQLGHRLGLDLPDPFPGDPVDLPDLIQGPRLAVGEPKTQPDDARFPLGQRGQHDCRLGTVTGALSCGIWFL